MTIPGVLRLYYWCPVSVQIPMSFDICVWKVGKGLSLSSNNNYTIIIKARLRAQSIIMLSPLVKLVYTVLTENECGLFGVVPFELCFSEKMM